MDGIKDYLISIAAAAIITGIIVGITKKSGAISSIVKLLAGLFMTVTVLHPLVDIRLSEALDYFESLSIDADTAVQVGQFAAEEEMKQHIKERCSAYVLEKAKTLGADIKVEFYLDDLVPSSVQISGAVSPFTKQQLSNYITANIGISLEDQLWIG